jgi:hypothetical protein
MIYEIDKDNKNGLNNTAKNIEQSLKLERDHILQESNIEKEQVEAQQRVFNQSPEYKKREINLFSIDLGLYIRWLDIGLLTSL